jgi:pimeloyl-ACP methyl ester carboxylesterase
MKSEFKTVNVQNVNIHFIDKGSGTPVLFLHGNPDSSYMWNGIIEKLHGRYRCVAPDLPGFGRSEAAPDFDCSFENMSRFIDELTNKVDIKEPSHLVMHDFGAHFGLPWAIKQSEKVKSIVISNTSFFSNYRWHIAARILRTPVLGELAMALTNFSTLSRELRSNSPKLSSEHLRNTNALYTPTAKRMALRLYRSTDQKKFIGWEDKMAELTSRVPTCVLWGDKDPYAPSSYAERFGARKIYHFPDCGHWLPVEAADEVAERLGEFFTQG